MHPTFDLLYNLSMGLPALLTPDEFTSFGDLLRYLRERAELSQRELALRVGYHYSYMSRIEKNERIPDIAMLMARFIPALGLEDQPNWTARLLKLASSEEKTMAPQKSPPPASLSSRSEAAFKSLDSATSHLPVSLTSLLGREKEIGEVTRILSRFTVRLVSLIGPPGVGKTRLAIQAASEGAGAFAHGVKFIDLAPIPEAYGFLPALAEALGVYEIPETPLTARLTQALRQKNLLLVLDNFEHLVDAAPQVHQILSSAPQVKILVTSREALHILGEHEYTVHPLALPEASKVEKTAYHEKDLSPAIQLFVERAQAVQPDFRITDENISAVLEICRRLDGLPLAIELAAARVKTLAPQAMLRQFDRRFDWLAPNKRDEQSSRQSLRGAIEWSHNLLSEKEQILLRRLSVFSGGWTLESAEQVCARDKASAESRSIDGSEVLDLLIQLADKSLIFSETHAGETRFHFLETLHQFGHEKLKQSGEDTEFRNHHLLYYCQLAEQAEIELERADQAVWAERCEMEHNNIRAALDWALQEGADLGAGMRLCASIGLFWVVHSHFIEGLNRSRVFLQKARGCADERTLAKLLYRTAELHLHRVELKEASQLGSEAVELCRRINDNSMLALALCIQGNILIALNDLEAAEALLRECSTLCWEIHYPAVQDIALMSLGRVLYEKGDHVSARDSLRKGLAIAEQLSDQWAIAYGLRSLADMYRQEGNFVEAQVHFERCLEAARKIGDKVIMGNVLANLAILTNLQGKYVESGRFAEQGLSIFQAIGDEIQQPFLLRMMGYAAIHENNLLRCCILVQESLRGNFDLGHFTGQLACLVAFAECYMAEKQIEKAVSLCVMVEPQLGLNHTKLLEPDAAAMQRILKQARRKLGKERVAELFAESRTLNMNETIQNLMTEQFFQ